MSTPHLPHGVPLPAAHRDVVPLSVDLGEVAGQRLLLLSLERWEGWADLRFARVDVGAQRPLARRVPPAGAWEITVDGQRTEVLDAVGRGDRTFSNGEVRLVPAPPPGAQLTVRVVLVPGEPPLHGDVTLPG